MEAWAALGKVVMGGDDKASEIALIPLKELVSEL